MINGYIAFAFVSLVLVFLSYFVNFYFLLGYGVSSDTGVWGQLGDYVGGLLNPILSFVSLVLILKSLRLQNEANESLKNELKNTEKTENIRSFEAMFFNMLSSQGDLFKVFCLKVDQAGGNVVKYRVDAVMEIEDEIEKIRKESERNESLDGDAEIRRYLEVVDSDDKIFGVTRVFYVIVKMISERLCDDRGFDAEDRRSHLKALINFTNFAQLRLIIISLQFMTYYHAEYLRNDNDLNFVLKEVGLDYAIY